MRGAVISAEPPPEIKQMSKSSSVSWDAKFNAASPAFRLSKPGTG
jgi:hypothetical protein